MATQTRNRPNLMLRTILAGVVVVLALVLGPDLLCSPFDPEEESTSHWLVVLGLGNQGLNLFESSHFSLATYSPHVAAAPWLDELESTYGAVQKFAAGLGVRFVVPTDKLHVIVFARRDELQRFAGRAHIAIEGSDGLYFEEQNVAVFSDAKAGPLFERITRRIEQLQATLARVGGEASLSVDPSRRDDLQREIQQLQDQRDRLARTFNRVLLRHEAGHLILYNTGVYSARSSCPLWLREGLACLFEVSPVGRLAVLSPVNRPRLLDFPWLKIASPVGHSPEDHGNDTALSSPEFHAAAKSCSAALFAMIDDDNYLSVNQPHAAPRYAQAWALVYYLSENAPQAFARYVRAVGEKPAVNGGADAERLGVFETAFGTVDEGFCVRWIKYLATK